MEYALSYAKQGWHVFPLQPAGKAPLTEHGYKDATRDPDLIQQWWSRWPEANVGVATGRVSGIVVLDVDRKHGVDGVVSAAELDLPPTLVIRTPSGGYHLIYKCPAAFVVPRRIGVRPGLDILGEGGYVVAAGSHTQQGLYEIARNRPIAECPQAIIDLATRSSTAPRSPAPEAGEKIGAGGRNAYLTRIGGKLRRIGFSDDELVAALLVINTTRCDPPVSEAEVRRTANSVARYQPDERASEHAEAAAPLVARPIAELLAAVYPPAEYVLEPILTHPGLMMVYGPTGVAKTYFCLALGLAISGGHNALKYRPERARGVLYIDGELGNRALQERLRKLMAGHEFRPDRFYTISRDDQAGGLIPDLNDAVSQTRFLASIPEDVEVVILDNLSTLTSSAGGQESNAWESWDAMQALLLQLRRRGFSVIVVHHANKGGTQQSGTERKVHIMDTVVSLRRHENADGQAPGYTEIEVHITKGRNLPPGHVEPYIATLASQMFDKDTLAWSSGELAVRKGEQIAEMLKLGMPIAQVITETGCNASFAYRIKDRLVASGDLTFTPGRPGRKRRNSLPD